MSTLHLVELCRGFVTITLADAMEEYRVAAYGRMLPPSQQVREIRAWARGEWLGATIHARAALRTELIGDPLLREVRDGDVFRRLLQTLAARRAGDEARGG